MATWPAKTNYATGDVLTAANMNTIGDELNDLYTNYRGTPVSAGKNLVINGDCVIAQRGTAAVAGTAYGYPVDRILTARYGFTANSTSQQVATTAFTGFSNALRIKRTAGDTSTTAPLQVLYAAETKDSIRFAGQSAIFSLYAQAGANYAGTFNLAVYYSTGTDQSATSITSWTGVTSQNVNVTVTTTATRFSLPLTVPAGTTQIGWILNYTPSTATAGANDYVDLTGFQIELGTTATSFSRAMGTAQGELAACQRYYQAFPSVTQDGYTLFGSGYCSSTTKAFICLRLNGSMRTYPTMTYSAANTFAVHTGASSVVAGTAIATDRTTAETVWFNITVASGLTAGYGVFGIGNATTSAKIEASAEL